MSEKQQLTVTLSSSVGEHLRQEAKMRGVSLGSVVESYVKDGWMREEETEDLYAVSKGGCVMGLDES